MLGFSGAAISAAGACSVGDDGGRGLRGGRLGSEWRAPQAPGAQAPARTHCPAAAGQTRSLPSRFCPAVDLSPAPDRPVTPSAFLVCVARPRTGCLTCSLAARPRGGMRRALDADGEAWALTFTGCCVRTKSLTFVEPAFLFLQSGNRNHRPRRGGWGPSRTQLAEGFSDQQCFLSVSWAGRLRLVTVTKESTA